MANTSGGGPFLNQQLTAVTSGIGPWVNCEGYPYLAVFLQSTAALSAGTLIVEESSDPTPTAGIASTIATVTLSSPYASTGGEYVYHLQPAKYMFVRTRIGTTAVGGLLSSELGGC